MTTRYKVYITKNAQEDLEHIFHYIAADSPQNASNFILEIEQKIMTLEQFPERNPLIPENQYFATQYRHLLFQKYRIFYRIETHVVYILKILRGAQLYTV